MVAQRRPGKYRGHLDIRCGGHQTCLLTRPVFESLGDLPSIVTRLCHVMQSARATQRKDTAIDREIESIFEFKRCISLPDEAQQWRRHAEMVLELSQAAGDMTPDDCLALLNHDNGNWRLRGKYIHWCLGPQSCPSRCTDEAHSLRIAQNLGRASLGNDIPEPLLYRWKHIEKAWAYMQRGRHQHDLLRGVLSRMWTKKELDDGEAAVERADDIEQVSFQDRGAAKAKSVLRALANDSEGYAVANRCTISEHLF